MSFPSDRIKADADPGDDLHVSRGFKFGLAKSGGAERHAVNRCMLLQQRLEIGRRNQIWKFDQFDVVALGKKRAATWCHRLGDEYFLLVGCHSAFRSSCYIAAPTFTNFGKFSKPIDSSTALSI